MVMLKSKAFLRTCVFLVAVVMVGVVSTSAGWALNLKSGEAAHYAENSIYFYDPDDCLIRSGSSGDGDGPLTGGTRAEKVWNYIVDLGISGISDTPEVIAGIMGNMQQESGFNPFVQNDGGCTGLIQWCGMNSYNSAFRDYMKNKGLSGYYFHRGSDPGISESIIEEGIKAELDYLFTKHSNTNNFKSKLNVPTSKSGTNGARAYADLFLVIVERAVGGSDTIEDEGVKSVASSIRYQDAEKRRDFAENLYAQFSGKTGGGGGEGGGDSDDDVDYCEEDDDDDDDDDDDYENPKAGDLVDYVKKWAWPDYHSPVYVQKMPAYESYIQTASYKGDSCYGGGVDCGAFVANIIKASGWDTSYIQGGTLAQKSWLPSHWKKVENTANLKLGDVGVKKTGHHVILYVGDIAGFNSKTASASQCDRAPMAGGESTQTLRQKYTWYRKK